MGMHGEARESMIDALGCMGGKGKHDRRIGMHGDAWGCVGRHGDALVGMGMRWDQKI